MCFCLRGLSKVTVLRTSYQKRVSFAYCRPIMKETISSLLLIIGVSYVVSQQCHLREVDLCMATGIFQYQSNGIPDDDEKITEWCETLTEVTGCMRNFSDKCMTPMQKELGQLLSGGATDAEHQLCTPGSELRNNYLKQASCLAEAAEGDVFKGLTKDIQVAVETTFEAKFKDRLPTLCCGFLRFLKGTEENTRRSCGEDAVKVLEIIMNMIITELPQTICQTYDPEHETCKTLLPPPGTLPKGAESKSQIAKLMDTVFSN